jgi:hypothetical protein
MAVATIGLVMLGSSGPARADILITVASGGTTSTFDSGAGNNTSYATPTFTINGYDGTVNTVTTNYPGSTIGGSLATSVNFSSEPALTGNPNLTVQVQLTNGPLPGINNLLWTMPASNPVSVTAASAFNAQLGVSAGTDTVMTYFNSTASTTTTGLTGTGPSSATAVGTANGLNAMTIANAAGSYTLSQTVILSGIVVGSTSTPVVFTGTSSVSPVPEPSSLAIAGVGALGLIGYGLRRRKA